MWLQHSNSLRTRLQHPPHPLKQPQLPLRLNPRAPGAAPEAGLQPFGLQGGAAAAEAPPFEFLDSPCPLNIWVRGLVFQMWLLGGQMCALLRPVPGGRRACLDVWEGLGVFPPS